MGRIAELIDRTLQAPDDAEVTEQVRGAVRELAAAYPLYPVRAEVFED
jgi:glycine/serine hydroxymethyltransferase